MKMITKALAGAAGLAIAAGVAAAPAAAQYGYPYGGYGGGWNGYDYGAGPGTVIGGVLDSILRGTYVARGYGYAPERYAIDECARAVEQRLGGGWNGARVASIDRLERQRRGLKIYGFATSARPGWRGGGYYGNYGGWYGGYSRDYRFNCKVDYYGRIYDVDIDRLGDRY